jgi:HD-like signal output (HDOD) protein
MKVDVRTFIQRAGKLPTPPAIYYELVQAIENPDTSIDEIVAIIRQD